jgi:hypothetical protein
MIFIILPLLCSGVIATVAAYFSIVGLAAIFEATYWPVIVMGIALEAGKLLTAAWLHEHWTYAPKKILWPLTAMVVALMLITSMGIFGFLSRGHLDQNNPVQQNQLVIDRKELEIKRYQTEIDSFIAARSQLDKALDVQLESGSANRALNNRAKQKEERVQIAASIKENEALIAGLQDELLALRKSTNEVTAKLGPIVYVFDLLKDTGIINKTNTDTGTAVRVVILVIVFAFDPLAVLLIIASQLSYKKWVEERPIRMKIREERHQLAMDRIAERKARREMKNAERRAKEAEEEALEKEFEAEERIEVAEEVADVAVEETKRVLSNIRLRRQRMDTVPTPTLEEIDVPQPEPMGNSNTDLVHHSSKPTVTLEPIKKPIPWLSPDVPKVQEEVVEENIPQPVNIPKEPTLVEVVANPGTTRLVPDHFENPIVFQKKILVQPDDLPATLEEVAEPFPETIPDNGPEVKEQEQGHIQIATADPATTVEDAVKSDPEPAPTPPTTVEVTMPLKETFEHLSDDVLDALLLVRTGQGTSPEFTAKLSRLTQKDRVILKKVLEENPELIPADEPKTKHVPWLNP